MLSYIVPNWSEYGTAKSNLNRGLVPPFSGDTENVYKNSCGAFIRSEIWACLAPGRPDIAAMYAYFDAAVDHAKEGVWAEIICAAMQSAAFVEGDKERLIEIGLSYIPADSAVSKAVRLVQKAYAVGLSFERARDGLFKAVPGSFGVQFTKLKDIPKDLPVSEPGFDAPNQIGIIILAWLYGEDDFGKSLCLAVNCGEDTDCTAATLGALFGIIYGNSGIPKKWLAPLNGKITVGCVNYLNGDLFIPKTVDELTDRILQSIPSFLGVGLCDLNAYGGTKYTVTALEGEELAMRSDEEKIKHLGRNVDSVRINDLLKLSETAILYKFPLINATLDYLKPPFVSEGEKRKLKLTISDNAIATVQRWITVTVYAAAGVKVLSSQKFTIPLQNTNYYKAVCDIELQFERLYSDKIDILIDIELKGRVAANIIKATFFAE
jgi:hypothetical protein